MKKKDQDIKKRLFFSHAGADYNENKRCLKSFLNELKGKEYNIFCSSQEFSNGYLHDVINKNIKKCDVFFALVTENYVRSPYCLYELSVAKFLFDSKTGNKTAKSKEVIIICVNKDVEGRIKDMIEPFVFYNLEDEAIVKNILTNKFHLRDSTVLNFLVKAKEMANSNKPYVGMSNETYNNLLKYCQQESIVKFSEGAVYTNKEIVEKCKEAKKIYIVSTTGAGLLKTLKEKALPAALKNQAEINIIIPDQGSQFCQDVAEAECCRKGFNDIIENQNKYRIENEFVAAIQYLNEAYCHAKYKNKGRKLGRIWVYNSRTLLRQTIFLAISKENCSWGWINMTMAPLRTTDTPSIAICDNNTRKGLDKSIIEHCKCLMEIARKHKAYQEIKGETIAEKLEKDKEIYWKKKREEAKDFMQKRKKIKNILIEVAAQHPLQPDSTPNEEFQKRLDFAIQLSKEFGEDVVWFYVPGSQHKYEGYEDKISLSTAGKKYLIEHDVNESHIYAEEANEKYKKEEGVYNSADESYVASRLFKDNHFGRMICVCSPYQTMRKSFYYIQFGLIAECFGIPDDRMFHDPVSEYFGSLHYTVFEDHDWQDKHSVAAQNSRRDRMVIDCKI